MRAMPEPLRIVFAGTPEFAVPALDALLASPHRAVAVYTQPDRPAGRGRRLTAPPVKRRAGEAGIQVHQPVSLRDEKEIDRLSGLAPDLMVVVAYGLILPPAVLDIPKHGCWNLHASLLPCWRGAAPIQRAILAGDAETGVSLMRMAEGLDTGPVLDTEVLAIKDDDTAGSMHDKLAAAGAEVLSRNLARLAQGDPPSAKPQDDSRATYAEKITAEDAVLDWSRPAAELARRVRAFNPVPGARGEVAGEPLKIWRARALPGDAQPGEVRMAGDAPAVGTGDGWLCLEEVQRPGRARVSGADYLNARQELKTPGPLDSD